MEPLKSNCRSITWPDEAFGLSHQTCTRAQQRHARAFPYRKMGRFTYDRQSATRALSKRPKSASVSATSAPKKRRLEIAAGPTSWSDAWRSRPLHRRLSRPWVSIVESNGLFGLRWSVAASVVNLVGLSGYQITDTSANLKECEWSFTDPLH